MTEPTSGQMMMMMDERHMQSLAEIMRRFSTYMQTQGTIRPPPSKLNDFQHTQLPKFAYAVDPLEIDDWIRTMEKKHEIARADELDKVPFAMQYFEGPANIWWDNLKDMRYDGATVTWHEFKEKFRKAHIPASLMNIKQKKFLTLTQGGMFISEYLTKFNNLACYTRDDTNTEEKKKDRFLYGLHQAIKTQLSVLQFSDFQAMVNTTLILEKEHHSIFEGHKRKFEHRKNQHEGSSSHQHTWPPNHHAPAPKATWNQPKKEENNQDRFYNKRPHVDDCQKDNACFKCGKLGHYIANCPLWENNTNGQATSDWPCPPHHGRRSPARLRHSAWYVHYQHSTRSDFIGFWGFPLVHLQEFCCQTPFANFAFGSSFSDTNPLL